jgi:hypothetical protein
LSKLDIQSWRKERRKNARSDKFDTIKKGRAGPEKLPVRLLKFRGRLVRIEASKAGVAGH